MLQHFHHSWLSFQHLGLKYGVNPTIFATIYALHYTIVWPTFAWILVAFRRKQSLVTPVTSWIFSMLIPWFYPLFFGRLPWFYDVALVGLMVFIVWHGYHTIQKRLAKERDKMEPLAAAPSPADVPVEETV